MMLIAYINTEIIISRKGHTMLGWIIENTVKAAKAVVVTVYDEIVDIPDAVSRGLEDTPEELESDAVTPAPTEAPKSTKFPANA